MPDDELLSKLEAENARLIALLKSHGIELRPSPVVSPTASDPSRISTGDKVALFRTVSAQIQSDMRCPTTS